MEVTGSVSVAVDGDTLFAYVGNPEKLVQYLPVVTAAQRTGSEVRVGVKRPGAETRGVDAYSRVLPDRHLEFGSSDGRYHGEASIIATDTGSLLMVTLNVPDGDYVTVSRELDDALATIKRTIEGGR
jgi:carbon monoxide dehydrogenase subunit G